MPTWALSLTLCTLLVTAGCLSSEPMVDREGPEITGQPSGETLGDDEYWMVWVDGKQVLDPPPRYVCSIVFDHEVDPGEETVGYSNDTYRFDPDEVTYLVAFDLWEAGSSCPQAYSLHPSLDPVTEKLGGYGNLTLEPAANGSIMLEPGTWLHPGQQASYSYETTKASGGESHEATGWFNVTHLGAWPQDGLQPG